MATLFARWTPPGRSAIAVVSLRGPEAWPILAAVLRRRGDRPLPASPANDTTFVGWIGNASASDETVVRLLDPENAEIHCHGGPEAIRLVEETLAAQGAEASTWQQIVALDEPRWRLRAMEILAAAPTVRTAAIALDQWNGAYRRALEEIARLRAVGNLAEAERRTERLRRLRPVGAHLVRPWKVVLAGAPNVGKSSLINALAGFQRSLVAPTAGTTRDVVTAQIALDGWPILLADTAGLHGSDDALEQEGMKRAERMLEEADLVVWVIDASVADDLPSAVLQRKRPQREIRVANKADLVPKRTLEAAWLPASALRGDGVATLAERIVSDLVPHPPEPGEAVPLPGDELP